jgi:hypothetical protein
MEIDEDKVDEHGASATVYLTTFKDKSGLRDMEEP